MIILQSLCHNRCHGPKSTRWLHRWHTLTSWMTWASEVNLSKFWPPDTAYPHGPINSSPCLLSYHYKQKLLVDVSMHGCPVRLPAGGHSKEVAECDAPPTVRRLPWRPQKPVTWQRMMMSLSGQFMKAGPCVHSCIHPASLSFGLSYDWL